MGEFYSQVFGFPYLFQGLPVEGVASCDEVLGKLVADSQHMAFVRVECHLPFGLPGFQFLQVPLEVCCVSCVFDGRVEDGVIREESDLGFYPGR